MQPRSQSLIYVLKAKLCPPLRSESKELIKGLKDAMWLKYNASLPLNQDKEVHEVTIIPRTPSEKITNNVIF